MNNAMYKTLKFKITVTAFILISVIMAFSSWRDIQISQQRMLDAQKGKVVLFSERIEHGLMVLMLKNQWQDLQPFMVGLTKDSTELSAIRIFLPDDGKVVASSTPGEIGQKIYDHDMDLFRSQRISSAFVIEKNHEQYASKLTVIKNQPVCHRCHDANRSILGVMDVEISLAGIDQSIGKIKHEHLVDTVIAFFLIGGGFLLVVGLSIDRPIKAMVETIKKIENGDSSARMRGERGDEFGLLARSFNSMLESLDSVKKQVESYHIQQMQRAAKLASLGEIIAGIAHEIKNPLTGISCAVQVLQSELDERDSRREMTGEILQQIRRLNGTVKGLLNYAKPKPPAFLPGHVNEILKKAIFFVYPEAKKNGVIINTIAGSSLPDVMMDADQMQQVFLNLMINAVQAMPNGGSLKITLETADKECIGVQDSIRNLMSGSTVVAIMFEDTGTGIEAEDLQRIFDPFYTRKTIGTGLGLSISQRIIHEHGGEITVQSEAGRGSRFTVYLPAECDE